MKASSISLAALLLLLPAAILANDPSPEAGKLATSMRIAGYDYSLPVWWDAVEVSVPANLKDWHAVTDFVTQQYDSDTGTATTWRQALKTWAIANQRLNNFPVYLAHCHKSGGENQRAAQIYCDLHKLAGTQKELKDWYRAYLAFCAGETYLLMNDAAQAKQWFARSANYTGHQDNAIAYYAKESAKKIKMIDGMR